MVMAQAGNRVLLLDTDLRAPTLQQIFSLDKTRGIARALVDIFDADLAQGSLGDFSPGELLRLLKLQDKTGHLMINLGYIEPVDLKGPLKLQMSEAIAHTLRWQEGSFSFQDREFVSYEKEVLSLYTDQDPFLGGLDLMLDTPFIDAE